MNTHLLEIDTDRHPNGAAHVPHVARVLGRTFEADILRFRDFVALPGARQLLKGGRPVEIGSRAFDLLVVLLASRGAIVSKNDIMKFVWPSVNVDESNLRFQIACLRKVLAHDRDVIKTISGRGYLFATDVLDEFMSSCDAAEPSPASSRTSGSANGAWFAA